MSIQQHLSLLGLRLEDKITGFRGTAATIAFMLNGSVQAVLTPLAKENARVDGEFFDVKRLQGYSIAGDPAQFVDAEHADRLMPAPKFTDEQIREALENLGCRGKDKISGWTGVVTDVGFDLYGCVSMIVRKDGLDKDGGVHPGVWVDVGRFEAAERVLTPPELDVPRGREPGPAEKPQRREARMPG